MAIAELRHALFAVGLTLLALVALYFARPALTGLVLAEDSAISHPRVAQATPLGGIIRYLPPSGFKGDAGAFYTEAAQDLQLLEHRFRGGRFDVASVPASRTASETRAISAERRHLGFGVRRAESGAELAILAHTPKARRALHAYLGLLESGWRTRSR